jgi:hypothetical protein
MAIEIIDNPLITSLEQDLLGGFGSFPDEIYLIGVGENKYACNNATLPDGQNINGLACFASLDDATGYMGMLTGLSGDTKKFAFNEAREIAKSKPVLDAMFLFDGSRIVEVHFVK